MSTTVMTWPPEVIPVRASSESTTLDGWILAVPCAFLTADPEWDVYDPNVTNGDPSWLPSVGSPYRDLHTHALWQFWPLEIDTSGTTPVMGVRSVNTSQLEGNSSLPKYIYDPSPGTPVPGHAWEVEWLTCQEDPELAGDEQVFAFLLDFTGRLHVLRVENLLEQELLSSGTPAHNTNLLVEEETWETPLGLLDMQSNNCFDVAVELPHGTPLATGASTRIFVAVRRVGVVVLRFDPQATPLLTQEEILQTGEYTHGVEIQRLPGGVQRLLVSDYGGGIRILEL